VVGTDATRRGVVGTDKLKAMGVVGTDGWNQKAF
jgi:hypothetical protein